MKTYTIHSDPGHAWLEVPKAELEALGIADKITPFSYMQGSTAYLEEDCDLSTFFNAMKAAGKPLTPACIIETYADNTPIRNYDAYKADAFVTKDAFASLFIKETMAAYREGSHYIEAVIDNGHSRYGGVPVKQLISDGCEIMTIDEATARIDIVLAEMFNKPWMKTTEEDYWSMMEVLPPEHYQGGNFRMSEYDIGTFTRHFITSGGEYYTAIRKAQPSWTEHTHELQEQLMGEQLHKQVKQISDTGGVRDEVNSEEAGGYTVGKTAPLSDFVHMSGNTERENEVIRQAKTILYSRMITHGVELTSPIAVYDFLQLELATEEQEIFSVLFLDTRHRLIEFKRMFYGTIDGASVHPREVVKAGLRLNAAAVIFAHNHPSGKAEPSQADITITTRLKSALALIEVRTLDHIVIGSHGDTVSLAQRGHL